MTCELLRCAQTVRGAEADLEDDDYVRSSFVLAGRCLQRYSFVVGQSAAPWSFNEDGVLK